MSDQTINFSYRYSINKITTCKFSSPGPFGNLTGSIFSNVPFAFEIILTCIKMFHGLTIRCTIHHIIYIYIYTAKGMKLPIAFGEVFSELGLSAVELWEPWQLACLTSKLP